MANGKDVYYFSHDSNARNDEKILMLRAEHGWEGYGLYWALIEMMFESKDTVLYHNKIKGIALSYNVDITLLQGVINTAIREGLFDSDDIVFWSESLLRRKAAFHELKRKKSLAGRKGMASRWGTDNSVITENNKGKESKVNKSTTTEKTDSYTQEFETFWNEYPRKKEKKAAFTKFKATKNKGIDAGKLILAAANYRKECEAECKAETFIKLPRTFLGPDEHWRDYLKPRGQPKDTIRDFTGCSDAELYGG